MPSKIAEKVLKWTPASVTFVTQPHFGSRSTWIFITQNESSHLTGREFLASNFMCAFEYVPRACMYLVIQQNKYGIALNHMAEHRKKTKINWRFALLVDLTAHDSSDAYSGWVGLFLHSLQRIQDRLRLRWHSYASGDRWQRHQWTCKHYPSPAQIPWLGRRPCS